MARARGIKPSIMDNEDLAKLDGLSRLLFIYLWMLADRAGRLEDRPERIAVRALPYDRSADVDAMLDDLAAAGFIHRYIADGCRCIQILTFAKHQTPHPREAQSSLPVAETPPRTIQGTPKASPRSCLGNTKASPSPSDSLIPDSLIPDSLIPDSLNPPSMGTSPETEPAATASAPPGPPPDPSDLDIGRRAAQAPIAKPSTPPDPVLSLEPPSIDPGPPDRTPRRARRCPVTFVVDEAMRAWAAVECPLVDIDAETATMRDHEFADARSDWPATWRNWLRREQKHAQRTAARSGPPGATRMPGHYNAQIALEQSNRAIAAAWRPPEFTTTH